MLGTWCLLYNYVIGLWPYLQNTFYCLWKDSQGPHATLLDKGEGNEQSYVTGCDRNPPSGKQI